MARKKFELEIDKTYSTLDVREEYIGDLEMENEKLTDELDKLKSIELNQFENENSSLHQTSSSKSHVLCVSFPSFIVNAWAIVVQNLILPISDSMGIL